MNISIQTTDKEGKDIISMLNAFLDGTAANFLSLNTKIDTLMTEIEKLAAAVEKDTAVDTSAVALIKGIADQLAATKGDAAKVAALTDKLNANADALAAAITANTPASNEPAPTPTPAEPGA